MKPLTLILLSLALLAGNVHAQLPGYVPQSGLTGWWEFKGNE